MNPIISIIVPIYNMEDYLDRCIISLLNQGLGVNEYEILLVNDGSKDNSLSICRKYEEQYSQVHLISQPNKGLSATRNLGISEAKGEYLCFVDADDYLEEKGLCALLPYCNNKNDLIRYWSRILQKATKDEDVNADGAITFEGKGIDYLRKYGLETFCWNYLYKKEFLISNKLKFKEGLIGEDFRFMFDVLFCNPHIVSIAKRIYCYVIREGSITTNKSIENSRKWVKDLLESMSTIKNKIDSYKNVDNKLYEKCSLSLEQKMPSFFAKVLSSDYSLKEYKELINCCKSKNLLPLKYLGGSFRLSLSRKSISLITNIPVLYVPIKLFYCHIFHKYIYPRLDRNN